MFQVDGFDSEESAKKYLNNHWAGLMWVRLNLGISFMAELNFDKVTYAEEVFEAAVNGNFPAVYPSVVSRSNVVRDRNPG